MSDHWHHRFIYLAQHVAEWSKDPSTRSGAVIVDRQRRVLGLGYNGLPRGVLDLRDRLDNRELKYKMIVHAEANAILNATGSVEGGVIYVWPLFTCCECAKLIIQAGITEVHAGVIPERYEESCSIAKKMYVEAGVRFHQWRSDVGEADQEDSSQGPPPAGRGPCGEPGAAGDA